PGEGEVGNVERHDGAECQEGAEGKGRAPEMPGERTGPERSKHPAGTGSPAPTHDDGEPADAAADRGHEHDGREALPAKNRADHRKQMDVAQAETFYARGALVRSGQRPEDAAPETDPRECVPEADSTRNKPRHGESDQDAGQADDVRDDPLVQVD